VLAINVLDYADRTVLLYPNKTMLLDKDRSFSFGQVKVLAEAVAVEVMQRTDSTNAPIAAYLPRSADLVIADLGILKSGHFYMNLDVASPAARTRAILDHVQPSLLITTRKAFASLPSLNFRQDQIVFIDELPEAIPTPAQLQSLHARRSAQIDTDPICIINTSGSTGIPKATLISHRGVIDFTEWAIDHYAIDSSHIIGNQSPFHFDIYLFELVLSMATGATLVLLPSQHFPYPARLLEYMARTQINFIFWVPTIMVNIANVDLLKRIPLPELKLVWFAGEVFPTRSFNYWRRHLPQARFTNLYGPIEITLDCTFYDVVKEFRDDEPLPIGRACRNKGLLILDENNAAAPPGTLGELCVRGTGLALGYYNDPERTSKVFCQNPLNAKYPELIYRTGDLVMVNDQGDILFCGRRDFQIKHQGNRIELGEIEQAAMACSEVQNCCVHYDQHDRTIVMFYESFQQLTPEYLRSLLAIRLPKYMIPTVFQHLVAMPLNPNGKIDRRALLEGLIPDGR